MNQLELQPFNFSKRLPTIKPIGSSTNTAADHVHLSFGFAAGSLFPINELEQAASTAIINNGRKALQYSGSDAQAKLIRWIKEHFNSAHSMNINEENILITYGAAQGIELTMSALIDPGDEIWVEAPTFFGALNIFRFAQANLKSFPVDDEGVRVDLLEEALIEAKRNNKSIPKLFYTIPMYQNPSGVTLSLQRRKKLVQLAKEYNFFILEDDAYMELNFENNKFPTLFSLCPERVIYINTFSKTIGPGIRLGWVIAEQSVIQKLNVFLNATPVTPFTIEIIIHLLESYSFTDHVKKLTAHYKENALFAVKQIEEHFANHVTIVHPTGGFFIWLQFAEDIDTSLFEQAAYAKGVSFVSGKNFYIEQEKKNELRICISYCDQEAIARGIKRIADAYFEFLAIQK